MKQLKIFSFYSGSGFLDLGFETNGFKIEFVNEFSPAFIRAYMFSRKEMGLRKPKYGYQNTDINEYLGGRKKELMGYIEDARSDGSLIGFIGGPPCPDFSIAGKQRGRNGDNGKLSQSYIDVIRTFGPDFFLFENVKGLWRTAKHRAFYEELKEQLHADGYVTTERLTNALEFGVPQDRDRILLFGVRNNIISATHCNGVEISDFPWDMHISRSIEHVKSLPWPQKTPFFENSFVPCPAGIDEELTVEHWFRKNDVEKHANAKDFFVPRAGLEKMKVIEEGDDRKKSYKRLHRWRYSPTAAYGNNEVHLHPYKARRISAAEAMAIQSLPMEFVLPADMSLSDKFKTIGNGVPYLLSSGIARTISEYMREATTCKE